MEDNIALSPKIRNLIGFSALIMIVFCLVVAYHISEGRSQAEDAAKLKTESLTNSLADHTELTLLAVDMTIRRAIERQYLNALFGSNLKDYMESQLKLWIDETPQVASLAILNDTGEIVVSASKYKNMDTPEDENSIFKSKSLFDVMKDASDEDVFVGQLQRDNKNMIVLARRFSKVSGEFGGIVVASLPPSYFNDFYHSIAFGDLQFMAIELLNSGNKQTLLASGPESSRTSYSHLLEKLKNAPEHQLKVAGVAVDVLQYNKQIAVIGSRKLKNFNIAVHVLLSESDIFTEWRQGRAKDIGFLVLFVLFGSVLSFFAIAMAKQMSRAEESESAAILASQAKSEFLANMSHELRTPLNAIIGYSEMINSEYFGPLNQKQKDRIHDINLCGAHLLQLINDILEFSKGEAGKLELIEEKVDIAEVVNEAVRISNAKARTKSIRLISSLDPELPNLWADRRKLMQVILNLLTNSIKFTPENGSVRVSVNVDSHQVMHITVTDTGVGMSEEDIPKALSVFGQVHRTHGHEGTGLGLPLCKMYIDLHGGKFVLTSKLGQGTTVHIMMPHQRTLQAKRV
jgi:signal transduction histidine kinase